MLADIEYSDEFERMIRQMHRGMEARPQYPEYIAAQMSGAGSRLADFETQLMAEIEHHCGPLAGRRVLDFGCGTGVTTVCLAARGARVVSVDISEESMAIARRRVAEHGLGEAMEAFHCRDLMELAPQLGHFDVILMNGVIEHMPLTIDGLRRRLLRALFERLEIGGSLVISDTPNRFFPRDDHTTGLWWIPWTKPGSRWAYERAVRLGRFIPAETYSEGTRGFEEEGAWGATYWEILSYLDRERLEVVNLKAGHDETLHYALPASGKRALVERVLRVVGVKILRAPITAFMPFLSNLVIRRTA